MEWLNYHHLLYFYTVAREGGVGRAAARLNLTQPTISGQIKVLEQALGERLFERQGRRLVLTESGRVAYRYADEIFSLGRELQDALKGRGPDRPVRLVVGVADQMPKMLVHRLLAPALAASGSLQVVCRDDKTERLLVALAIHDLDVVLADAPLPPGVAVRAYNHLLGECGETFFATPIVAARLRRRFPASLDGAAMLLPTDNTAVRRTLDQWFESQGIRPAVVGEVEDSALLAALGRGGVGVFCGPSAAEGEIARQYGVAVVGRTDDVRERFYAISGERKLKHPAVVAIMESARHGVFG